MPRRPLALLVGAAIAALCTAPVSAAIIGGADIIAPPTTLGPNPFGQDRVVAFYEQQNITLGKNVDLGRKVGQKIAKANGSRDAKSARTVSKGTLVSSHYVAYDPDGVKRTTVTVSFDSEILGVVVGDKRLAATDFLGADGVDYKRFHFRTKEWRDKYKISADGKSITLKFRANTPGDHYRIITAGTGTPPPPPPPPPRSSSASAPCSSRAAPADGSPRPAETASRGAPAERARPFVSSRATLARQPRRSPCSTTR